VDRFGIAVSSLQFVNSKVKPIALASTEGGPYYQATKENLISRKYPLARGTYAYINRPPRLPVDPKVKEFLHYILSNEGQNIVHRDGQYLPLTIEATREQLLRLE
jgi:phosphate transport system substrate-binding protein